MTAKGATVTASPGDDGLRSAVQAAQEGDTVLLANDVELLSLLRIEKRLTIRSSTASVRRTIHAIHQGGMFEIAADGVTLEGLTLRGSPNTNGLLVNGDVTLRECAIRDLHEPVVDNSSYPDMNTVRLERVEVTLNDETLHCMNLEAKDCTFSFNFAGGAGGYTAHVEGCVFENNDRDGFSLVEGAVKNCVFRSNGGFGVYFDPDPGNLVLSGCLFDANEGGGILLREDASATVDNCTFTRHDGMPAIIVTEAENVLFRHCTVANNIARPGTSFYPDDAPFIIDRSRRVELQNCLVADNQINSQPRAAGLAGDWTDGGGNVLIKDPKLGSLANNGGPTMTLLPLTGSAAINAGRRSDLYLDARGLSRLAGSAPDAGAVETGAAALADADADGLPDIWETFHGLNPADASDAAKDRDGDGQNALAEFNSHTNPADPKSVLRVAEVSFPPLTEPGGSGDIRWVGAPGILYRVEMSTNLREWSRLAGFPSVWSVTDGHPLLSMGLSPGASSAFFRVVVKDDPFK